MKFISILVLALLSFGATAKDKKVNSKINSVTVFQNGAQIFRSGSITLSRGHQLVRFSNLSPNIRPESIQMNGKGNFTIMSVTHQLNYLQQIRKTKRMASLSDSINKLSYEIKYQQQYLSAYQQEINFLKVNANLKGKNQGASINEIKSGADYYRQRFRDIYTSQLKVNTKISKLKTKVQRLQLSLNQLRQSIKPKGVGEILVEIDSRTNDKVNFSFNYLVNNARWTPLYDIRATTIDKPIKLIYRANIYQNTGVDWKNIKVTISTGNPQRSGIIPTLYPWYLNFNRNNIQRSQAGIESDMEITYPAPQAKMLSKATMANNASNYTTVKQGQTNTSFAISLPYTIPSSNKKVNVKVQKWELSASYRYYAVPRIDPIAFLQARISGWQDLNLMPGSVNIFFEGTYVGKSYLNPNNLNDTLDISLGRDRNIVIQRAKIKDKSSTAIFGNTKKVNKAYKISIKNNKKTSIHLVIKDQIPLSKQKNIEIKLLEKSGAKLDASTGFLTWDFTLDTRKAKKLTLKYQIKYPKNLLITNLW